MVQIVPGIRTTLTTSEALSAIRRAYETLTGQTPAPRTLAILASQSAFETGSWQRMKNWNFGFFTVLKSQDTEAFVNSGDEQPAETEHYYQSFNSPDVGALAWIRRVKKKWPLAWQAVENGDFESYHEALLGPPAYHTTGYDSVSHTWRDRDKYRRDLRPLYNKLLLQLGVQDTGPLEPRPVSEAAPFSSLRPSALAFSLLQSTTPVATLAVLRFGIKGPDVAFLQFLVKAPLTGSFDGVTELSVTDFQSRRGLKTDGIVGPLTWQALKPR